MAADEPTEPTGEARVSLSDSAAPAQETLPEGTRIDHFELLHVLGRGGMGEVYLARDTKLGRRTALKLIRKEMLGEDHMLERFLFEARATAQFNHQHIVTIYEVGEHEGRPYLALELLDGQNLRERIRDRRTSAGPSSFGVQETARIGEAISDALAAAHEMGILHRDLKPANIVIPSDGRLRVVDFGLAVDMHGTTLPDGPTDKATTAGTPAYMAPEQWRAIECTPATDVWALGVILFQLCSGRRPYQETSELAQSLAVCSSTPAPLVTEFARVPVGLSELIRRCLEKSPSKRPTAAEAQGELREMLHPRRGERSSGQSPFRGLMPFSVHHADTFFGRDAETAAFVERIRLQPVLPVVGPSGAGKSSFVQAGVIPRLLEQDRWMVLALRPSADPFRALAAVLERALSANDPTPAERDDEALAATRRAPKKAREQVEAEEKEPALDLHEELRRAPRLLSMKLRALAEREGTPLLLFVDQLEELFTLVDDDEERRAFLEGICTAAADPHDPVRVVFTIRHDFLDRLAESPEARDSLAGVTVVQRPSVDALRQILTRPVEELGYRYEDAQLVDEMIASVAGEPACLPLLQFAAEQLWVARASDEKLLLRSVYERIGGVEGALARHADGVLDGFTPSDLVVARHLLLRLVTVERTRKTVAEGLALEGLGDHAEDVLARFVRARLISVAKTADGAQLELAHESLIVNWTTLAHWLDAGDDELTFMAELGAAAELWDRRGRGDEGLWRRKALAEAEARLTAFTSPVPALVGRFIEEGQRSERTRQKRVRLISAGVVVVLAGLSVVFGVQRREADVQRERAEQREQLAEQRHGEALLEGAREALVSGRMLEARAKLRTASELADSALSRALWWQLERRALRWRARLGATVYGVAYSPDGRSVAAASQDHAVYVFDVRTGRTRILRGHDDQVFTVAFSPDGGSLASATWSGEIRVWDVATGETRRTLTGHSDKVTTVTFSPDGERLASASSDHSVRVWHVASGREERVLRGHEQTVESVAFSPDGGQLASAGRDATIRLWDLSSGRQERAITGSGGMIHGVAFSGDGAKVVTANADGSVRFFDGASGEPGRVLEGSGAELRALRVSPDGETVAAACEDGSIFVWDVGTGRRVRTLRGHDAAVRGIDFSPDGAHLVSGGMDWNVRLWAMDSSEQERVETGHTSAAYDVAFSADGTRLASAGKDATVRLWDVETGRQDRVLAGHSAAARSVAFSPDGTQLASGGNDHSVRLWDVRNGEPGRVLAGHTGAIRGLSFSPDGALLASSSYDGTARIWDVATGDERNVLRAHTGEVLAVRFSPDGTTLATGSFDRSVRLWEAASGRELRVLTGHDDAVLAVAFSPDGTRVASTGWDRSVRFWDVASGEQQDQLGPLRGRGWSLELHPDGRRLVVAVSDGTAQVWDLETREVIDVRDRAEMSAARFAPDGRLIATSSDEGTVRVWGSDGRAMWRAPMLWTRASTASPPLLLSHRGWSVVGEGDPPAVTTRWRAAVEERARLAAIGSDGDVLCLLDREGGLEMWDVSADRRVRADGDATFDRVLAVGGGCLALTHPGTEGRPAVLWWTEQDARELETEGVATALGGGEGELFVIAGDRVVLFDGDGQASGSHRIGAGATAVSRVDERWLAVGYRDGNLELVPTDPELDSSTHDFERVPSSPVLQILVGPMSMLIVGHANGVVALYDRTDGKRLEHTRVHGPVEHLQLDRGRLHAVSGLGDSLVWDLSTFSADRCELLREIWEHVPVVWEGGRPLEREAPSGHPCGL